MTDKLCEIIFFEGGDNIGTSSFSAEDAKKAGTGNMGKFPRNMLFARAISNGARWYVPGIFGGAPVYTPEELGAEVDEDGYIIDVEPQVMTVQEEREEIMEDLGFETDLSPTRTLPVNAIDEIVALGLAENVFSAKNALKKSNLSGKVSADQAIEWMTAYRGARIEGSSSGDAAKLANMEVLAE